jgi:hypothetical protein
MNLTSLDLALLHRVIAGSLISRRVQTPTTDRAAERKAKITRRR